MNYDFSKSSLNLCVDMLFWIKINKMAQVNKLTDICKDITDISIKKKVKITHFRIDKIGK